MCDPAGAGATEGEWVVDFVGLGLRVQAVLCMCIVLVLCGACLWPPLNNQ